MIAFFDASALIYLVEGSEPFSGKVRSELAAAAARHPELAAAVSRLTWLECRVQPMKANDPARLALFDGFFARPELTEGADQPAMRTGDIRFDRNTGGQDCSAGSSEDGVVGPIGRTIHISPRKERMGRQACCVRFQHPSGGRQ